MLVIDLESHGCVLTISTTVHLPDPTERLPARLLRTYAQNLDRSSF